MTSKTRYSHRVRCSNHNCRIRFRVKKHPDLYSAFRPKCPECGSSVLSIEKERRNELIKQDTCYCFAYPFPHRAGSLRMCDNNPLFIRMVEPTDDEWQEYQDCLKTPRSG